MSNKEDNSEQKKAKRQWKHKELVWKENGLEIDYTDKTPSTDKDVVLIHLTKAVRALIKKEEKDIVLSNIHKALSRVGYSKDQIELIWNSYKVEVMDDLFSTMNNKLWTIGLGYTEDRRSKLEALCRAKWETSPKVITRTKTAKSASIAHARQTINTQMNTATGKRYKQLEALLKEFGGTRDPKKDKKKTGTKDTK